MLGSGELPMQGSPPFDGDVEESHELRYTLNSTTTGSPHTDLVSTPDQPSHDTHAGQPRLAPLDYADRFHQPSPEAVPDLWIQAKTFAKFEKEHKVSFTF